MRRASPLVVAGALLAGTVSARAQGWDGQLVKAEFLYPAATIVLESHDVVVRAGIELPDSLITSDFGYDIDIGPDTVQFNFWPTRIGRTWTAAAFNGWSFSDLTGTIPAITGYAVEAVSTGIGNEEGIVTSFDADHAKASFAGVTVAGSGAFNFIRLKLTFAPWTNLGSGLAGSSGAPSLAGSGTLLANSSGSLDLTNAKASSLADLFISFASAPTPFKGGTLLPVPVGLTLVLLTDGAGSISLPFAHWPTGIPPGATFYFQYAVQDAAGPLGVSLSNAVKAVTP